MNVLWPTKALAEICEIRPPKSEAKRSATDSDLVSFVPMEDLGINQKFLEPKVERKLNQVAGSYTYFAEGDVLLAKITPCFENGKLGIARGLTNGIGFGSSEYIVFRPANQLSNEYLYYFLLQDSFRSAGIQTMSGAVGHKRVAKEFIERFLAKWRSESFSFISMWSAMESRSKPFGQVRMPSAGPRYLPPRLSALRLPFAGA